MSAYPSTLPSANHAMMELDNRVKYLEKRLRALEAFDSALAREQVLMEEIEVLKHKNHKVFVQILRVHEHMSMLSNDRKKYERALNLLRDARAQPEESAGTPKFIRLTTLQTAKE